MTVPFDGDAVGAIVRSVAADVRDLRERSGVEIVTDGPEGPTTSGDVQAQAALVEQLLTGFGPAGITAEEGGYRRTVVADPFAPLTWIIDPLDGTSAYLSGADTYGVQVAAYGNGRLLGGWISCPDLGWHVSAWEGGPLLVEGVEQSGLSARTLIADGDFDDAHLASLARRNVSGYARTRSCAAEYALVTAGLLDTAMYHRTHPWDHAPGAYLVRRAGGRSIRWNGDAYDPGVPGKGILSVSVAADLDAAKERLLV